MQEHGISPEGTMYPQPRVESEGRNPGLGWKFKMLALKGRRIFPIYTTPFQGLGNLKISINPGLRFAPPWAVGTPSLRD